MSFSADPVARLSRPRWRDPRLLLGVLLILVSVVAGARVVAAADTSARVWAAASDLGADTTLTDADLVERRVHLDAGLDRYVSAEAPKPVGLVLVRPIGEGEILPRAAVADVGAPKVREVPVEAPTAGNVRRGSVVDVYAQSKAGGKDPAGADGLVVANVTVADVLGGGRTLGSSGDRTVVLSVPQGDVQAVVDADKAGDVALVRHVSLVAPATRSRR